MGKMLLITVFKVKTHYQDTDIDTLLKTNERICNEQHNRDFYWFVGEQVEVLHHIDAKNHVNRPPIKSCSDVFYNQRCQRMKQVMFLFLLFF